MKAIGRFGTAGGGQIVRAYREWIMRVAGIAGADGGKRGGADHTITAPQRPKAQ
jgi:hypothetical protein